MDPFFNVNLLSSKTRIYLFRFEKGSLRSFERCVHIGILGRIQFNDQKRSTLITIVDRLNYKNSCTFTESADKGGWTFTECFG